MERVFNGDLNDVKNVCKKVYDNVIFQTIIVFSISARSFLSCTILYKMFRTK